MTSINFVPNDYVQQRQSSRANFLYLTLLAALLGAIGVTFSIIKIRQSAVRAELDNLNHRMSQAREQIAQLEQLKVRGRTMMKSMVMTAELLEPVPRSVILASLTNNLPSGVSLLDMQLVEKERKASASPSPAAGAAASQYQKSAGSTKTESSVETKSAVETTLEIEGIAPSDIEVAGYIANLSGSILLDNVELIQSKEQEIDGVKFRQFRLRSMLKPNLTLTKEDITKIRQKREETM